MQIQIIAHALQEKLQNGNAGGYFQIEGTIDKFEIAHTTLPQLIYFREKRIKWKCRRGFIQSR